VTLRLEVLQLDYYFCRIVRPVVLRHTLPFTRRQASWVRVPLTVSPLTFLFALSWVGGSVAKLIPRQRHPTKCHRFAYIVTERSFMLHEQQA
jgi:hypothetical protein